MSDQSPDDVRSIENQGKQFDDVEQLDEYMTSPLRALNLHVLDQDGEALCGSLPADQRQFIERHGLERQPTLRERIQDKDCASPVMVFLGGLCGNCRNSLVSESGAEPLREIESERKQAVGATA